jgi:long-chain acyl-CoA synthetase
MVRLLNKFQATKKADTSSVAIAVSGGEPLPAQDRENFRKLFGTALLEGYGLTEASPVVSVNPPGENRAGSVGRPLHNVEVKIADGDGRGLKAGEEGEICVKGVCVMKGYYNREEDTRRILDGQGWLKTGDYGTLDGDGYLYVTGRKKEMMIIGGENVFPKEIEDVLMGHPDVFEAAVIGIQDASRGEAPKAFVVPRKGCTIVPEELRSFCKDKIVGFKIPKIYEICSELPHGPTGKIIKKALS